jgi:hypothetical protein
MSLRRLRQWAASVHVRKSASRSEPLKDGTSEVTKELFAMREDLIQGIAGHLLDGLAFGFNPQELGNEAGELFNQVIAGKADLDMEWLENRREHASTREPAELQRARHKVEVEEDVELENEEDNDEEKEWEQ